LYRLSGVEVPNGKILPRSNCQSSDRLLDLRQPVLESDAYHERNSRSVRHSATGSWAMFATVASWIATSIEATGIIAIVLGAVVSISHFLRSILAGQSFVEAYPSFRSNLGRSILLGLELLVAADIVGTVVVDPTFVNLGVLSIIVAIRIALSFALEVEISGHWPWQQSASTRDPPSRR